MIVMTCMEHWELKHDIMTHVEHLDLKHDGDDRSGNSNMIVMTHLEH